METAFMIIGVLGSIASIAGAILSIKAENNAKTAAQQAEQARDSIVERQATSELTEILASARTTQKVFGKYSISDSKSLAGTDQNKDSVEFQDFIFRFNENRFIIEENSDIDADSVYQELNDLLREFSSSRAIRDKKESGSKIRLILDDIIFKLKKNINELNTNI